MTGMLVLAVLVTLLANCGCGMAVAPIESVRPASCSDVDVVFARGTNQPPGFGRVGDAFLRAFLAGAAGAAGRTVSSYAVDYPADTHQDFGLGTNDLTRHVIAVAAKCPATKFVLGGYSQGASVVTAAIGVPTNGSPVNILPSTLATRVAAVVVFGNPLGSRGQTIDTANTPFRAQSADFCDSEDPVCGRRGPIVGTHRDYPDNGATDQAATFALHRLPN
jgi:cutinase